MGDSLQWEIRRSQSEVSFSDIITIDTDNPNSPLLLPRSLLLNSNFSALLNQIFDYANRSHYPGLEDDLKAVLGLPLESDGEAALNLYRRIREYIESGRNDVWQWYIENLAQPLRLTTRPPSRLIGNPPWVVYNAMEASRQDRFREQAMTRGLWAGRHLATQNDLAASFVATCVDYYLKPGGRFGFVLPYAALRTRHWQNFRSGNWSLPQSAGRNRTLADLSHPSWDLSSVNAPPFPQANSSVLFGSKMDTTDPLAQIVPLPLRSIEQANNTKPVNTKMTWDEVKPTLTFTETKHWRTASSLSYINAFRNGATLFPQSLVVFERPKSEALGTVYFRTNSAKGAWKGTERDGQVEQRFVKSALFSRLLIPFGIVRNAYVIAPFSEDMKSVSREWPQGRAVQKFSLYWSSANADYRQIRPAKSPDTLAERIDLYGNLSAQLETGSEFRIVYNSSGSHLCSSVVSSDHIVSHTFYWAAFDNPSASHYLSAIFNARCLGEFFRQACRASDRHFMLGPVQNLPIPAFDSANEQHVNLALQSKLAHERVEVMVAEREHSNRQITRNNVLQDKLMQPMLESIDTSVRAIFPDYCS